LCGWLAGVESDELLFNEHLLIVPKLEYPLAFDQFVVLTQGLKVLDADNSIFAHRLQQLTGQFDTLEVVACAKSLAQLASKAIL